jgi:hypothetical protein
MSTLLSFFSLALKLYLVYAVVIANMIRYFTLGLQCGVVHACVRDTERCGTITPFAKVVPYLARFTMLPGRTSITESPGPLGFDS